MHIKFSDVLDLFELVNFGSQFEQEGYICKESGKTYFYSELGDDEEEELPEDINNEEKYLMIPDKNELNLGINLAFEFVQEQLPAELEKVQSIFRRQGAYSRYKYLLEGSGKLEEWYVFEAKKTEEALREWCTKQDIEISI